MTPKIMSGPCAVLDGYMYFFTFSKGVFARMDLTTGAVELLETAFDCILGKSGAALMMAVDRSIYALTWFGRYLVEYCVDTAQTREIEIDLYYEKRGNIAGWFEKEGKIYIYPMDRREEVIYDRMSHMVSRRTLGGKTSFKPCRICPVDDCVYIFEKSGGQVIRRNIDTGVENTLMLNGRLEEVRHVVHKDDRFYILTAKREIHVWDCASNDLKLLCKSETDDIAWNMAVLEDKIVIPPHHREEIQVVDTESGAVSFLKEQPADFIYHSFNNLGRYSSGCEDQNNYYFSARTTNYVLVISKKDGELSWIRPLISSEEIMRYLFKRGFYVIRETYFDFSSFLAAAGDKPLQKQAQRTCIGDQIWKEIASGLR